MALTSSLGRGFVRSGSGYVSTPTTRAAARAAGTFGAEGYAGAEETTRRLLAAAAQRSEMRTKYGTDYARQYAMGVRPAPTRYVPDVTTGKAACPRNNEYKPIYPETTCPIGYWKDIRGDGLWCVCDMWKSRLPVAPPPTLPTTPTLPPTPPTSNCFEKCKSLVGIPILYNTCIAACQRIPTPPPTPPTPTPTPSPTPPEQCPDGLMYDKPLISGCKNGYVPYDPGVGQKEICICVARYEEAMKLLKPSEDGNGEGELGDLGKYTPYFLLAAGIGLILSMIKR